MRIVEGNFKAASTNAKEARDLREKVLRLAQHYSKLDRETRNKWSHLVRNLDQKLHATLANVTDLSQRWDHLLRDTVTAQEALVNISERYNSSQKDLTQVLKQIDIADKWVQQNLAEAAQVPVTEKMTNSVVSGVRYVGSGTIGVVSRIPFRLRIRVRRDMLLNVFLAVAVLVALVIALRVDVYRT